MTQGLLLIVSGPSGSGKSTAIARLMEACAGTYPLRLSVSATTRQRRDGEMDGVHYHFWTPARFEQGIAEGAFLEWAKVYGNYYGTLRSEVEPERRAGRGVILDIDIQGAAQVRAIYPDLVSVFLRSPSLAVYEERLRKRGTDNEASIRRRLASAEWELRHSSAYDYQILNDDLDRAVAELVAIVRHHTGESAHAR